MDAIKELICPELLILIPVLYFIGIAIKKSVLVSDKYIPSFLGIAGIVLATLYTTASAPPTGGYDLLQSLFVGITQGVLCSGCSVYVNQLLKQSGKDE